MHADVHSGVHARTHLFCGLFGSGCERLLGGDSGGREDVLGGGRAGGNKENKKGVGDVGCRKGGGEMR